MYRRTVQEGIQMKAFDSLNQTISSERERRKKEMAVLNDTRRTYLTLRSFPYVSASGADKQARRLCLMDALVGSVILTMLFLLMDLINQFTITWGFYPLLFIAVSITFSFLNWRRYSLQKSDKKVESHED